MTHGTPIVSIAESLQNRQDSYTDRKILSFFGRYDTRTLLPITRKYDTQNCTHSALFCAKFHLDRAGQLKPKFD